MSAKWLSIIQCMPSLPSVSSSAVESMTMSRRAESSRGLLERDQRQDVLDADAFSCRACRGLQIWPS